MREMFEALGPDHKAYDLAHEAAYSKEISMAHINIAELWWTKSQLTRQRLSRILSKLSSRPLFSAQSQGRAGLVVSCPAVPLVVALVLLCLVQFAHGSFTKCVEFPRVGVAVEHTIQVGARKFSCREVGPAPENYHSCSNSALSCWSCLELLNTRATNRQPIFLQSASGHGRSQTIAGREVGESSPIGKLKEGFPDHQFGMRKLIPLHNNKEEHWKKEARPDLQQQRSNVIHIATVCHRDRPTSSSLNFSRLMLDKRFNSQWECNSTRVAQVTTGSGAVAATAAESITKISNNPETAPSEYFVNLGSTTFPLHKRMESKRKQNPWLLQIVEAVDRQNQNHQANECRGDGALSVATVAVDGRHKMGRRMLLSESWKSVIVVDSVVVAIAFFLSVSALSCWVWERRVVKADGRHQLPALGRSTRRVSAAGEECLGSGLPRSASMVIDGESGRWRQVPGEGPGRWHWVQDDTSFSGSPRAAADEAWWRGPPVETDYTGRNSWAPEQEDSGSGPLQEEEYTGSGSFFTEEGGELRSVEESESTGYRAPEEELRAEEEDRGTSRGLGVGEERSGVKPFAVDGEGSAVTAYRPRQTLRYRAEPFCLQGLAAATGGFDERCSVGAGSFGTVYRGLLFDGRVVAIKRADYRDKHILDKESAFKAELDVMSRLHHKHLVNLVGYCDDCGEMMLVYDYMPNGTLSDHLYDKRFKSRALSSWKARIRVALQAARGIEYLHTSADPPVVHRDIKSSNILLDVKGSVRVADFGLCFVFPSSSESEEENESQHVTAKAAGTMGYMDPEYYRHRHLTTKSDVYSFGVVILELLTGKRAIFRHNNSHLSLVDYAVPAIEANEIESIADPRVRVPIGNEFVAMKVMAEIGSQAVRLLGKDRPSMTDIVRRLEQAVILCRSRHTPLRVFGAQIGSSSDLSASLPAACPSGEPYFHYNPAKLLDELLGEREEEELDLDDGAAKTDVAQVGSLSSSQARIFEDFLQDMIYHITTDDNQLFEHYPSNGDLQFYNYDSADCHDELLHCPLSAWAQIGSAAVLNIAGSVSLAAAANGYDGCGQAERAHSLFIWQEMLSLQDSRESYSGKFGESGVLSMGNLPTGGSFYSGKGYLAAASTIEVLPGNYFASGMVHDPLLDQGATIMAGFSNFSNFGPPQDINPLLLLPPPSEEQHEHELLPRRENGRRHVFEYCDEHNYGPQLAAGKEKDQGSGEFEGSEENHINNVGHIGPEVLDEYTDEQIGSTSYAGFSNFSVLHDLGELIKALDSPQENREQENLEEFLKEEQIVSMSG